jgi:3-deoxy-D-manno-octulosonic-acid transferase
MTLPLIRALEARFPDHAVFFSTMTETGQEAARKFMGDRGTAFFSPLDFPWVIRRVLDKLNPSALFIAETEIWPNLLYQSYRRGIPVVIFNGRISDRSFRQYRPFRFFLKNVLHCVSAFGMQTGGDAERVVEIGAPKERVFVTGNLKFDRPIIQPEEGKQRKIRTSLGLAAGRPVFVAGSTHSGEEDIVLQAFSELKQIEPSLVLILAPRHLTRLNEVISVLNRGGFLWVQRSHIPAGGFSGDVILLDTMGELEGIYGIGHLTFVGGSLVPVGGHNILEPAAFGKPVMYGFHMENFREVARIIEAEGAGLQVRDARELVEHARKLLTDRSCYERMSLAAIQAIQKNQGATKKTLHILRTYL